MRALPDWATKGLILGIQGGTDRVLEAVSALQEEQATLSAMWMQDWQGQREVAQASDSGGTGSWMTAVTRAGRTWSGLCRPMTFASWVISTPISTMS